MSLVPILYTSLILFAIVMVIVISVSYIAYKIRNRNEKNDEEKYELTPQPSYIRSNRQPVRRQVEYRRESGTNSIKVVPTIKNPELKKTTELPVNNRRTQIMTAEEFPSNRSRETQSNYESYENGTNDRILSSRTNPGSFRQRLEVLNKVEPKQSPKENFNVGGSGSIALPKYYRNFKAIHYYSDDEDETLHKPYRYYE